MKVQAKNYIWLLITIVVFVFCLYEINIGYNPTNVNEINDNLSVFILPFIGFIAFLLGCYLSALIVENAIYKIDKYCGVLFLTIISIILFITDFTTFEENKLIQYISGKKFSRVGALTAIGVAAILSGFIDNFGLRLGSEAMSETLTLTTIGTFSKHNKFLEYERSIKDNLLKINSWVKGDWRKVMNHVLRFQDEISKNKKMSDLTSALSSFDCSAINVPTELLKNRSLTNEYIDNLRSKYDILDESKGMIGNTFSSFIGSLRGAGIAGMLLYLTSFDDVDTGDVSLEKTFSGILNKFKPMLEGIFLIIGCLIPILLNIAMKRNDCNNSYIWIILLLIFVFITLMLFYSYYDSHELTTENKSKGISNTLKELKIRYKINSKYDKKMNEEIDNFLIKIQKLSNSTSA